jgi:hypothetical protein
VTLIVCAAAVGATATMTEDTTTGAAGDIGIACLPVADVAMHRQHAALTFY